MTFRKELFTFIHPSSSHAVQPPPPPTQASPLPILLTIIPSLKPIKHPPPHPIITLIPPALYNTLFSLLSHYYPQKRKHALPSTSRPNPLPQHHSQNVPFLIYHDNPPPFIFLIQNPPFIANPNFQPPVSYTYFFSDCAILYSIMSPKLLPEV